MESDKGGIDPLDFFKAEKNPCWDRGGGVSGHPRGRPESVICPPENKQAGKETSEAPTPRVGRVDALLEKSDTIS